MARPTLYDKLKGTPYLPMLELNHELGDKMMAMFRRILLSCKRKGVDPKKVAITGPYKDTDGRLFWKVRYGKENPGKAI